MAVTVINNATTIWDCESITGAVGNKAALDDAILKENANSCSFTSTTNVYAGYSMSATDLSGQHFRSWYTGITFPYLNTKALDGIQFYADDGSNIAYWQLAGKDTYQGGWLNTVVYLDSTPTSGSVNTAAILELGYIFSYASTPRNVINTWVDYFRYGDGLTAYGTAWGIDDVYLIDSALGNGYGIIEWVDKPFFLSGSLEIGRTSEQTTYSDTGVVMVFSNKNVNTGLYGILFTGDTSVTSTFSITGSTIDTASSAYYLDMDDTNIATLTITGNTINGASASHFLASAANAIVTGNTFNGCGTIYPQGSDFDTNTINGTTEATNGAIYLTDTTTISNCVNLTFNTYTGKYAVYIPASITGSISFDNFQFDGSGTDVYWAGAAGTLDISLTNGTNASTYSSAGGTVNFVANPVTTLITVKDINTGTEIVGARVYLVADAGGPLTEGTVIFNELTDVNGQVSDSRALTSAQPVLGRVRMSTNTPFYKTVPINETISNTTGLTLNISMIPDE